MKVKSESEVAQWCPTLSNPMDDSLPGSSVHGIFQARVLEWGAIACSDSKSLVKSLSRVLLFATLQTVACQAPPSMGFSRQEYWSGLPFPSPEDLPHPGIELRSPALGADALTSEPPGVAYFIYSVDVSVPISQFIPPPTFSPLVTITVFYICESISQTGSFE